jgi:hypothetical protein
MPVIEWLNLIQYQLINHIDVVNQIQDKCLQFQLYKGIWCSLAIQDGQILQQFQVITLAVL